MQTDSPNDLAYQVAARKVQRKLKFFNHLILYVVICCVLIAINLLSAPQHIWAIWPILGWGLGLALHAAQIFYVGENSALQQRMIGKEMQNELQRKTQIRVSK